MEPKRTVVFVARRFAESSMSTAPFTTEERGGYRAVITGDLSSLRLIRHIDEVVLFLDCGEEMLAHQVPDTGIDRWRFHYLACAKNVGPTSAELKRTGHASHTLSPIECGGMDTLPKMVEEYLSTGEIPIPDRITAK